MSRSFKRLLRVCFERTVLESRNQLDGETTGLLDSFPLTFGALCVRYPQRRRDRIILGLSDKELCQKRMMDGATLGKATEILRQFETVKCEHAHYRGNAPKVEVDRVNRPHQGSGCPESSATRKRVKTNDTTSERTIRKSMDFLISAVKGTGQKIQIMSSPFSSHKYKCKGN